ncbi:MAG: flagellar basal body-associated FliL family protein [Pseudomonadota bacterium]
MTDAVADDEMELAEDGDVRKTNKLIPLVAAAALIIGGGAYGWFSGFLPGLLGGGDTSMKAEAEVYEIPAYGAIVALDPIIISLPDQSQIRRRLPRLSVTIALEVKDEMIVHDVMPQLRNDFIEAMRTLDIQTLRAPDGLEALRSVLETRAEGVLGASLEQVLITEFLLL